MKFVKALNSGITTDLGLGKTIYHISTDGEVVPDDVAEKLSAIFGPNVVVSDSVKPETPTEKSEVETPATEEKPEDLPEIEAPIEAPTEEKKVEDVVDEETPSEE